MKELESEIAGLQREKDDLNMALASAKASANSSKLVHHSVSVDSSHNIDWVIMSPTLQ